MKIKVILAFIFWCQITVADEVQSAAFRVGELQVLADGPSFLDLGIGVFDFSRQTALSAAASIEYRHGKKLFFLGPTFGIMANTDGGIFGYSGLYADIRYRNWVATPVSSLGGYHQGNSKNLGGTFQFRNSISLAYQFHGGSRFGIRLAHTSNAGIYNRNPGANEILLTYTIAF
jgi:lipid A 3-O-deacylase